MPHEHTTAALRQLVQELMSVAAWRGHMIIAGGMVPWLLSGRDAGRLHGDLDVVLPHAHMPAMRQWLIDHGWYVAQTDSVLLAGNHAHADHGLEAMIHGIAVNVAPYCETPQAVVQYNCTFAALGGEDALLTVTLPSLTAAQYATFVAWQGTTLGHFPLALVKAAKLVTNRPKDMVDIREIDRLGVSAHAVAYYQAVFANMQIAIHRPSAMQSSTVRGSQYRRQN